MSEPIAEARSCMSMPARRIRTGSSSRMGAAVGRDLMMVTVVMAAIVGVVLSSSAGTAETGKGGLVDHR
jgi:hypothetical protein